MKTMIRLKEQSDLGLHCLPRPVYLKTSDHYSTLFPCRKYNLELPYLIFVAFEKVMNFKLKASWLH